MHLVAVAGACSRAGKTALAVTLLDFLRPREPLAVKFTTTEDVFERCPRGTPCVVCDIDVPFRIVQDRETLDQPRTDTRRMRDAGARDVVWCIARQSAVPAAWRAVQARVGAAGCVVMEGSTIVGIAAPALTLFVAHPHLAVARWKETTAHLVLRADAVIVNVPRSEPRAPAPEVLERLREWRGRDDLRVADVTRPLGHWAPDLERRLMDLASPRTEARP